MDAYLQAVNKMPKVFKIFFCILILDWFWAIWRVVVGVKNKSAFQILVAVIWFFIGAILLWVLDLISIIVNDYPFWFKEELR